VKKSRTSLCGSGSGGGGGGMASSRDSMSDGGGGNDNASILSSSSSPANQGFLRRNDMKKKREEEYRRHRWVVPPEEPKFDESDQLRTQWSPLLLSGEDGVDKLFPNVPRKGLFDTSVYMAGIDQLSIALDEHYPAYVDNLDLIFKWFTLRLCDKENVQVLQKLLDLMLRTVEGLRDNGYSLMEFEALILIPHVLEKSGQVG